MNIVRTFFFPFIAILFLSTADAKDFVVTENYSHELNYQPSLTNRLSGTRNVLIFEPKNKTQNEDYVISNLCYQLQQMGLRVDVIPANYKVNQQQYGNVVGRYHLFDDYISDYWKATNALAFVINYVEAIGYYNGNTLTLKVSVVDFPNNWQWNFDVDVPSKGDKLRKKFAKEIGTTWKYNSSYAFIPKSKRGNFDRIDIEQNFKTGNYNPFEGIYEGDTYSVGMKKANDGKYYLIFLGSKEPISDWHPGDIKAELRESSTPGVFKGTWYGRWKQPMQYNFIFDSASMIAIDEDQSKETYIRMFPTAADISQETSSENNEWGGSAFALKDSYVATNFHVIENARNINILGVKGDFSTEYIAEVVTTDKTNDLAILKITDSRFSGFGQIPYSINTATAQVGEDIFVLGYPLTSTMGDEIKLTTGVISSKTGYQGDITLYQISAPIQPGNSGGPLFDASGNIIGIVSAKHSGAENVGYALKASYLSNLVESMISSNILPKNNLISTLSRPNKVKKVDGFVFMVKCSGGEALIQSKTNNLQPDVNNGQAVSINNPYVASYNSASNKITKVIANESETIVEFRGNNGYYSWISIDPNTYIVADGKKYKLQNAEGIGISPNKTNFSTPNNEYTFKLFFPPIPTATNSFDLIESPDSEWKYYGIRIR